MRPLQYSDDRVMESGICVWILGVCAWLSPVLSGPVTQHHIHRVDSSRLNVSLDITHEATPERETDRTGAVEGLSVGMCGTVKEAENACVFISNLYSDPLIKAAALIWFMTLSTTRIHRPPRENPTK